MVAKRVISACARVRNLLEVLRGSLVSKVKAYKVPTGSACGTAEAPDSG